MYITEFDAIYEFRNIAMLIIAAAFVLRVIRGKVQQKAQENARQKAREGQSQPNTQRYSQRYAQPKRTQPTKQLPRAVPQTTMQPTSRTALSPSLTINGLRYNSQQLKEQTSQWFNSLTASIYESPTIVNEHAPAEPIQPRESASTSSMTAGSMAYQSPEGECDTHPEHDRIPMSNLSADQAERQGLSLELDPQSLMQAVVFTEVLGKPVSMRRRRAYGQ
ncbi:hypothetical protein FACS1894184_10280 [Clostridia bacterium]|nr:hypothetical protein FACS1894184_10280 [Clostridia bacterium]